MFRVFVFLLCIANIFAGKCTLRFEKNRPAIFWRTLGSKHVLLDTTNDQVEWDDRYNVTGFCPGEFRHRVDGYYGERNIVESGTFSCSENQYYFQELDGSNIRQLSNELISCTRTAQYYEASIPLCTDYGLAYGFFIEDIPLTLAGACYDLKSMQSRFLHYIAGPQHSVVEYRVGLNSVNITTIAQRVTMDCINIEDEKKILAQTIEKALPKYTQALQFELNDLISFRGSQSYTNTYFDDINCVNMIPWWVSLKHGNWKTVEEIVVDLARHNMYDIYTGTSGVMTYPSDEKCSTNKQLTYEVNHYVRKVPLYIWKYIRERNNKTDKGVVLIGVNSPFAHNLHRSEKICSDMCDERPWMEQLHRTRRLPTLGLVFCCLPSEVESKLDNFPAFIRQTTTPPTTTTISTTSEPPYSSPYPTYDYY